MLHYYIMPEVSKGKFTPHSAFILYVICPFVHAYHEFFLKDCLDGFIRSGKIFKTKFPKFVLDINVTCGNVSSPHSLISAGLTL